MPVNISNIDTQIRSEAREDQPSAREKDQEIVQKVAERVYEMFLQEMRIEHERGRAAYGIRHLLKGGR